VARWSCKARIFAVALEVGPNPQGPGSPEGQFEESFDELHATDSRQKVEEPLSADKWVDKEWKQDVEDAVGKVLETQSVRHLHCVFFVGIVLLEIVDSFVGLLIHRGIIDDVGTDDTTESSKELYVKTRLEL